MQALTYQLQIAAQYFDLSMKLGSMEGFLFDIQGYALMLLAEQAPGVGAVVEIGSYMGKSTCWLALGTRAACREKVTAIDHFKGSPEHQKGGKWESKAVVEEGTTFNEFMKNITSIGVEEYVLPIQASSEEAANDWEGPIRLLFIDGDHSYEDSKKDFDLWSPFVVPGGFIAFHDVGSWPGVTQFYKEMMGATQDYTEIFSIAGLNVVRRRV